MKKVVEVISKIICDIIAYTIAIVYVGVITIVLLAILIGAIRWILVMLGVIS